MLDPDPTTRRRGADWTRPMRRAGASVVVAVSIAGPSVGCGRVGYGAFPVDLGADEDGDVGPDGGVDTGTDTGLDAGVDTGFDAGPHGVGPTLPRHGDLRAFPTAEGFGAGATGGRAGRVLHVTTLATSGPGSLADAVAQTGPRTVVFDVSGHIPGTLHVQHGDLTLAGQTSSNGVSIEALDLSGDVVCEGSAPACPLPTVFPESVIVRHLRIRGGGIRVHHARNVMFDHVSVGNAPVEAIALGFAENITVQYGLLGETTGLANWGGIRAEYADSARGFPLSNLSLHHNLFVRVVGGYLLADRPNLPDASVSRVSFERNVVWGARGPLLVNARVTSTSTDLQWALSISDNAFVQDPNEARRWALLSIGPSDSLYGAGSTLWLAGNTHDAYPNVEQHRLIYQNDDFADALRTDAVPYPTMPPSFASATALPFPAIGHPAAESTLQTACRTSGTFPRDRFDTRMVGYVLDGQHDPAGIVLDASGYLVSNPHGDLLTPASPEAAPLDSDGDGMPDSWELARSLDPFFAADGNWTNLDLGAGGPGYTNLEVYLEDLARARVP